MAALKKYNPYLWTSNRLRQRTQELMGTCRVCGKDDDVAMYDPRGLWAYFFRRTYCPAHCPEHDYIYDRYEGRYCDHCGQNPPPEWYEGRFDD